MNPEESQLPVNQLQVDSHEPAAVLESEPAIEPPASTNKIKSLFGKIRLKKGGGLPVTPNTKASLKRLAIILTAVFFVVIMIAVAAKFLIGKPAMITSTPSPAPTATPEVLIPSAYANDEEVLAIEAALDYLEGELKIVNLREDEIMPPILDWDVNFKK